jgi:C_GCAxxG_C_C family probable redox protein
VVKAMEAFGGGLGLNGEACGALIGALATLGLKFGRGGEDDKGNVPMISWYAGELLQRFREEVVQNYGSINCRDITGVDWKKPEQAQAYFKGEKFVECQRIVGDTAKILGDLLERKT